jgi:hypothetical protein
MTDAEFREWLRAEVERGAMTQTQQEDMLEQKLYFDEHRAEIEQCHQHQVVGYVNGTREVGGTVAELLNKAQKKFAGRMVYFESIGYPLF